MDEREIGYIVGNGHRVHLDRGTYTHALFAQNVNGLSPDHEITENGKPIRVPLLGRNLRVKDVLPERLALAVDSDGEIIRQTDFKDRYIMYLRGFKTNRNVNQEPIPNAKNFLMKQIDPARPPERGRAFYVDLGFDASRDTESRSANDPIPEKAQEEPAREEKPEPVDASTETAPCGKEVRAGFVKQHKNFCKKPECAKPGVAVSD